MSERKIHVRRTLVAEYAVETKHYEGMTEDEMVGVLGLLPGDDLGLILDNVVSQSVETWFSGGDPDA